MASRCLAVRWGAYGDMLYALPALESLKKKHGYLHLETGPQGALLFRGNPTFDRISEFHIGEWKAEERGRVAELRWGALESAGWDEVVNFWQCLEVSCIAEEWQEEFGWPRERRREHYGARSFYDQHFERAGIEVPDPFDTGTFHFSGEMVAWMRHWQERHAGRFVVAMAVGGSTPQKLPTMLEGMAREIEAAHSGTLFYLLGDASGEARQFSLGKGNVVQVAGRWSYLQSLALVSMADYAIGPETSLLVGAGMFGVPKTMMCSSCGVGQATKYQKNDFSIQSEAPCSPCHRAIYSTSRCNYGDGGGCLCNERYGIEAILGGIDIAYGLRGLRREVAGQPCGRVRSLPDLQALHDLRTHRHGEI